MGKLMIDKDLALQYYDYDINGINIIKTDHFDYSKKYDGIGQLINNQFIGFYVEDNELFLINNYQVIPIKYKNVQCYNNKTNQFSYNLIVYIDGKEFINTNYEYYYGYDFDPDEVSESIGDLFVKYLNSEEGKDILISRFEKKEDKIRHM